MNIKEKFLELTSRTYPHGTEKEVFSLLGDGLQEDEFGNLYIKIGESDVMFTSHLDTATSALTQVVHTFENNIIKTDGKSILGADDKAGVTIMLHMIENNIPGLYYFFLGEEVGCVGSKKVAEKQKTEKIPGINKVISFDRRGKNSVITYQSGQRCCSDKFGSALADELNKNEVSFSYKNDPTGLLTDSVQFIRIYSECTNISVGYNYEHTFNEQQDIEHLEKLAEACLKIDWKNLPVERDPSKTEYSWNSYYDYDYGSSYNYGNYGSSIYSDYDSNWIKNKTKKDQTENVWFHDKDFNYVSKLVIDKETQKYVSVDLCRERVQKEKDTIELLLRSLDLDFTETTWDGFNLSVKYTNNHTTLANRNDLVEYMPELDYKNVEELEDDAQLVTKYYDEDFFD